MNHIKDYINSFKTENGGDGEIFVRRSVIIASAMFVYALICMILDIRLVPWQVFSILYLFIVIVFTKQILLNAYVKNDNNIPVMLTYLPATIWFLLFTYFDLFILGFGPAKGFRSVMTSLFYFAVILVIYMGIVFGVLDNIHEHFGDNKKQAAAIGAGAAIVTIIIIWYFSLRAFYATELKTGLTEELCSEKFGLFSAFWSALKFFR